MIIIKTKDKISKKLLGKSNKNFDVILKFTNLQNIPNAYNIQEVYDNIVRYYINTIINK